MSDLIIVELLDAEIAVDVVGAADLVIELLDDPVTVDVIPVGYPGAKGDKGDAGGYTHTQASAAATWTIAHNLGYRPTVAAFTTGGLLMLGSVTHLSDTVCQLDFNTPVAGTARLA